MLITNNALSIRINISSAIATWLLSFMLLFSQFSLAGVTISNLDDINLVAWAGSTGNLVGSDVYCVRSCSGGSGDCNTARNFDIAAYTDGATDASGNFYLGHDTNGSAPPIRVNFQWTNPTRGTFTMTNYSVTGFTAPPAPNYAPGATSCAQAASQQTITITLPSTSLASAIAGTYSETFYVDACRQQNGFTCATPVDFVVNLPELIQLTQLQDFNLGTWNASGNLQQTKNFCVFRNGYGGFSLTATGSHNSGGNFRVADGSKFIPYSLEFRQAGLWYAATPDVQLSSTTTSFTGNSTRNCGGGTSHSVRVTVNQANLGVAKLGSYSDTVTLVVAPN